MTMPTNPKDVMRRTMANLKYVEDHRSDGLFEVTQLVNSFLCALILPWDTIDRGRAPWSMSIAEAEKLGWPNPKPVADDPTYDRPNSLGDLIGEMRNALSHGQAVYIAASGVDDVTGLRFTTHKAPKYQAIKWTADLTTNDVRKFLTKFVETVGV